ncbi:TlpA family protein disulfide reductase [Pedobacter endophyticus]|uniref:TlpA family protein disulfide reductase n=1 Tax=Pedobacter endophyticus TaxID=2789740 RepID=A0A7U3Q5X3_9SPHI|nr:TlpA disulfide reductase family protein [Pedobacter endophyticus]QPH38924.1 TlpA family protein disulfide reductase [Pedobacter endophyticus]
MKKFALFIIILLYSALSFAEIKSFHLKGKIEGSEDFKYAYVFDSESKLLTKQTINNRTFELSGRYDMHRRFGGPAILELLLTNVDGTQEQVLSNRPLSRRRYNHCVIFVEDSVQVVYNGNTRVFTIQGGVKNDIQNKFHALDILFLKQRDSSNAIIDLGTISENEKINQKNREASAIFKNILSKMESLILKYPDSEVSLLNFYPILFDQQFSAEKTAELFERYSVNIKKSDYWIYIQKIVKDKQLTAEKLAKPKYSVGMIFPPFSLKDSRDNNFSSQTISNKFTLIDFWATWCVPCRKETPNLIKAYGVFKEKGFNVITISIDELKDKVKWAEVLNEDKMNDFINLFNGGDLYGLASTLQVVAIPTNYLVDDTGKIVAMNLRGEDLVKYLSTKL